MTAIVVNLSSAAVTEYDWTFPALSATRAGSDDGLFTLGGSSDGGESIDAVYDTGRTLRDGSLRTGVDCAYLTIDGTPGTRGMFRVQGDDLWEYEFEVTEDGVSRAKPGKGIRENLLGFGYANLDGADFKITRMEVRTAQSKQRRV